MEGRRGHTRVVYARHALREWDDPLSTLWLQLDGGNPEGDDDPSEAWTFDTGCGEIEEMSVHHHRIMRQPSARGAQYAKDRGRATRGPDRGARPHAENLIVSHDI